MPKYLQTFDEVIFELGGQSAVGRLVKRAPSTVAWWRDNGRRFPAKFYPAITHALEAKGCEAPRSLWNFFEPVNADDAT